MRLYALFAGESYYASGGWRDFVHVFTDAEEAALVGEELRKPFEIDCAPDDDWSCRSPRPVEWWHVVDLATCQIVLRSVREAYSPVLDGAPWP